ncbi:MAG: hypothetical protein QM751_12930 [Paludibacteraceae bacterium]
MFIIQNTAFIPLRLSITDRHVSFYQDILKGKRINRIMLYSSSEDRAVCLPDDPDTMLSQVAELDELSLFLNLYDRTQNLFVSDFDMKNLLVATFPVNSFVEHLINREIDIEKSYIAANGILSSTVVGLIVFYQTKLLKPFSDTINGSVTITLNKTTDLVQDFKLSDYITNTLRGKFIRQIIVSDNDGLHNPAYLDILCRDGKRIDHLPLDFLRAASPKDFYFDMLDIDFENSYLRIRDMSADAGAINLTFIY